MRMRPRCRVWAILCLAYTPASAQAPTNVNDCTLLPDPVALRRCVDGFGPQNQRPALLPSPAPPPPAADAAAEAVPAPGGAVRPPTVARPSADWLHETVPAAKRDKSNPNAIRLDD